MLYYALVADVSHYDKTSTTHLLKEHKNGMSKDYSIMA